MSKEYDAAKIILTIKDSIIKSSYFKEKKLFALNNLKTDEEKVDYIHKTVVEILAQMYNLSLEEITDLLESNKIKEVVLLTFCKDLVTLH